MKTKSMIIEEPMTKEEMENVKGGMIIIVIRRPGGTGPRPGDTRPTC